MFARAEAALKQGQPHAALKALFDLHATATKVTKAMPSCCNQATRQTCEDSYRSSSGRVRPQYLARVGEKD
jgi:hypothetical protein